MTLHDDAVESLAGVLAIVLCDEVVSFCADSLLVEDAWEATNHDHAAKVASYRDVSLEN